MSFSLTQGLIKCLTQSTTRYTLVEWINKSISLTQSKRMLQRTWLSVSHWTVLKQLGTTGPPSASVNYLPDHLDEVLGVLRWQPLKLAGACLKGGCVGHNQNVISWGEKSKAWKEHFYKDICKLSKYWKPSCSGEGKTFSRRRQFGQTILWNALYSSRSLMSLKKPV